MYRIMPKSKCTLTTTIVGEWIIDEKDKKDVDSEMRLFQCAVRTAFNRLLEGMEKGDVEKLVSSMFNINSRYAKDAVMQATCIISSQRELVKQHFIEKERLISGLRKKLKNISSEDKRESISARIEQLIEEVAVLKQHIENSTIPKVIFGGRENFEKRVDGKLSNADWKNLRNNKLYSRGDKSKEGGNLNTRIERVAVVPDYGEGARETHRLVEGARETHRLVEGARETHRLVEGARETHRLVECFSLSVAISHLVEKPKTAPRVTGKLWVDVRHRERLREHLENGGIYSIELIRGIDNKYRVHITFDEFVPIEVVSFSHGAIGVDVNPDGIALTEIEKEGNPISCQWIALPELAYSRTNRRDNLIGETAKEIVSIANSLGKGLVIESLNFVKKNKGKRFNRMSHNFVYRRLLESIERRAIRCGVAIKKVHPAYTSIIGKYKYATDYGLSFHQAAALVIARRGLGFRERIPKKIQRLISVLISSLYSLLPAMEAKGAPLPPNAGGKSREVKRLLSKLKNWSSLHSWSFWHTFNQSLRKVGVKPWLLRDINLLVNKQVLPVH